MKYLIFTLSILLSELSLAHGSVGTMRVSDKDKLKQVISDIKFNEHSKIIYNMGTKGELIYYAQGELVQGQWNVKQLAVPSVDVVENSEFIKYLEQSEATQNWVEIK